MLTSGKAKEQLQNHVFGPGDFELSDTVAMCFDMVSLGSSAPTNSCIPVQCLLSPSSLHSALISVIASRSPSEEAECHTDDLFPSSALSSCLHAVCNLLP